MKLHTSIGSNKSTRRRIIKLGAAGLVAGAGAYVAPNFSTIRSKAAYASITGAELEPTPTSVPTSFWVTPSVAFDMPSGPSIQYLTLHSPPGAPDTFWGIRHTTNNCTWLRFIAPSQANPEAHRHPDHHHGHIVGGESKLIGVIAENHNSGPITCTALISIGTTLDVWSPINSQILQSIGLSFTWGG